MTNGLRKPSEFCWFNMRTPDPEQARAFFSELLGWTYADAGMGHTVGAGGRSIGAMFDLADPKTPKGTPPLIGVMVKVESADDTAKKVKAAGGKAQPAFDIGGAGRMAVCHDPDGAEFDVWEPKAMPGTDVDSDAHGAPTWFSLMTTDFDRASKFYAAVFGWETESAGPERRILRHVRGWVASMQPVSGSPSRWGTYFAVKDMRSVDGIMKKLRAHVFAYGRERGRVFAGIHSPEGVPFYITERRS